MAASVKLVRTGKIFVGQSLIGDPAEPCLQHYLLLGLWHVLGGYPGRASPACFLQFLPCALHRSGAAGPEKLWHKATFGSTARGKYLCPFRERPYGRGHVPDLLSAFALSKGRLALQFCTTPDPDPWLYTDLLCSRSLFSLLARACGAALWLGPGAS